MQAGLGAGGGGGIGHGRWAVREGASIPRIGDGAGERVGKGMNGRWAGGGKAGGWGSKRGGRFEAAFPAGAAVRRRARILPIPPPGRPSRLPLRHGMPGMAVLPGPWPA
ncbi:MAG: hypothetical protein DI538_28975 [Azospira oryzae]|nr:MAG: hypothetical protein DI538_28975 [Azospira oryzae]